MQNNPLPDCHIRFLVISPIDSKRRNYTRSQIRRLWWLRNDMRRIFGEMVTYVEQVKCEPVHYHDSKPNTCWPIIPVLLDELLHANFA